MEQDHAGSRRITRLEIMEMHTVALDKGTNGWVLPFRQDREHNVPDHQKNQSDHDNDGDGFRSGHSLGLMTRAQSDSGSDYRALRNNRSQEPSFPSIIEDRRKDQQPPERSYRHRVAGQGFVLANPTGMGTHRSDVKEN